MSWECHRIYWIEESPALLALLGAGTVEQLKNRAIRSIPAFAALPADAVRSLGGHADEAQQHARWQLDVGIARRAEN